MRYLIAAAAALCLGAAPLSAGVFELSEMRASAAKAGRACQPHGWNTGHLGPQKAARSQPAITVSGNDLADYRVNSEPVAHMLLRMNAVALGTGRTAALKTYFLHMVGQGHFTRFEPYRPVSWHGTRPQWVRDYAKNHAYSEPAFSGAVLLIASAQSYGILKPDLSAAERKAVAAWGAKVARLVNRHGSKGSDAKAGRAAAFTTWGAVAGDKALFRAGVSLFRSVAAGIRKDGSERFFSQPDYSGRELHYHNMTYGFLSIAAWAIEKEGGQGFTYRRGNGGSLIEGLNFLLDRTFDPDTRRRIARDQDVRHGRGLATTGSSIAWVEYAIDAGHEARLHQQGRIRALRNESRRGYFSGFYGGFTTCVVGG